MDLIWTSVITFLFYLAVGACGSLLFVWVFGLVWFGSQNEEQYVQIRSQQISYIYTKRIFLTKKDSYHVYKIV
uniref:Uncharacterized protein n=1 Tax=Glossina palpalis gambiensis TaxID=67801 RepID=A0A1B0BI13_9MUSC